MFTRKRVLIGLTGLLLLAGGIGASIADRGRGHRNGEPHGFYGHHDEHGGAMRGRGHRRADHTPPMTQEELEARLRERFARLDRNSDGIIDRAEVEAGMVRGPAGRMEDRGGRGRHGAGHMFRRFDENRDGKVTKDEIQASLKRRFTEMDLDGDGKITEADLPPMLRGSGVLRDGETGMRAFGGREHGGRHGGGDGGGGFAWLKAADADKDGVITLDEVLRHADKGFARWDRNGDGSVDTADRDLMRKEMTDYRVLRFLHRFGAVKEGKVTREQFTTVSKERWARMQAESSVGADDRPHGGHGGPGGWRGRRGGASPDRTSVAPQGSPPAGAPLQPGGLLPRP